MRAFERTRQEARHLRRTLTPQYVKALRTHHVAMVILVLAVTLFASLLALVPLALDSKPAHALGAAGPIGQVGYVWENDDQAAAATVDANTQQAAGNTAITSVKKGERLTARVQLRNTGSAETANLSLFYDHGDGIWSKVRTSAKPATAAGDCNDTNYECTTVQSTNDVGNYSSLAVDQSGAAWVSYYDTTNHDLWVAHYVGTNGTGCATTAWDCKLVDSTGDVGKYSSIGIAPNGKVWVSYYDLTNFDLKVAYWMGDTNGTGCAVTPGLFSCVTLDTTGGDVGMDTSIAFDSSGVAWISYYDNNNGNIRVAKNVGSGGTGCTIGATWNCTAVDATNDVGRYTSLAFDSGGTAWMSYVDVTNGDLRVAKNVGSGGTGCSVGATWTCTAVDSTNYVGGHSSIAFDSANNPWVSYYDATNLDLRVATYVGSGGNCTSSAWNCSAIDSTGDVGQSTSMAFAPDGNSWVTYKDVTNGTMKLARYVGSGGTGCATSTWSCTTVDNSGGAGTTSGLAFDVDGNAQFVNYAASAGDLHFGVLAKSGEITIASGSGGSTNGAGLNASHSDMSSVSDSSNKTDADCITGSTTWNNGKWWNSEEGSGLTIPAGSGTAQCTEVAFTINTSQAQSNTTYRFVVASKDGWRSDKNLWRGPSSVTYYPTITTETATSFRASKVAEPDITTNCTATTWGCATISTALTVDASQGMAFDSAGTPWMAFYETSGADVYVAQDVGASGSGCTGNTAWTCTKVDGGATVIGNNYGIGFAAGSDGSLWLAYEDSTNKTIRAAKYVGSGGSGCTSSAWTCTVVYTSTSSSTPRIVGISLTVDAAGNPWISASDTNGSKLVVAHLVGANGSGCTSTAWSCITPQTNGVVDFTSIAIDSAGNPWISYSVGGTNDLGVIHYVGAPTGSTCIYADWDCTSVVTTNTVGMGNSIAIDSTGVPWISYIDGTTGYAYVAKYVGASGTGCATATWACTRIDTTTTGAGGVDMRTFIAFDSTGAAWVALEDWQDGELSISRYVGASGTGCTTGTAWSCTTIQTGISNSGVSLAFDSSGVPWVPYRGASNRPSIAKLHLPSTPLSYAAVTSGPSRNARTGDSQYTLDSGGSPRGTCSATSNYKGYCGIATNDSDYDSTVAPANSYPMLSSAGQSASNATFPSATWIGQSNVGAATKNIILQVYRFGSTNAWTTLTTNSSLAANTDGTITGTASAGSASEYWQADGSNYWSYFRVYQATNSSAQTLKTNYMSLNLAPNPPTTLAQYRSDGTTGIPATTLYTYDSSVGTSTDSSGGTLSINATTLRTGAGALKDVSSAATMVINDGASTTRDLSANGPTLSAWVYVPAANTGTTWTAKISVYDSSAVLQNGTSVNITRDTWTLVTYTPGTSLLQAMKNIVVTFTGASGGTNTAYVDDLQQGRSTWTNETGTIFKATVSDLNSSDTDSICVEAQPINTTFTNTETGCGTGVAYNGTGVTASVSLTLTSGTRYHWQARTKDLAGVYSSWLSYGGNTDGASADTDVGVDTAAPSTGTVYDGTTVGTESRYNTGSLTTLSANWSGFSDAVSGLIALDTYSYSIGTTAGATDVLTWTSTTTASFTATGLTLHTGQRYYVNVRAYDVAGNTSSVVSSPGQVVAPILTFTTTTNTLAFANLNSGNSYADTKTLNATVTTNAYSGYQILQYATGVPTSTVGGNTISMYSGTWAVPTTWSGTGFGYTSSDTSVGGSNRYSTATKYAGISTTSPGDVVADSSTTAPTGDTYTLTYKFAANSSQKAGRYQATILLSATATF